MRSELKALAEKRAKLDRFPACTAGEPINFLVDGVELERAQKWEMTHRCRKGPNGATGGQFSYTFFPCSIGTAVSVRCGKCGKETNATDYSQW